MAKLLNENKCRYCRAEGEKLFLKGSRCFSSKCPLEKKGAVPPGMHGLKRAKKPSDYALQLRAKQKAKRMFGILEKQFRIIYEKAKVSRGVLADNISRLLEMRLDNVVYVSGLSLSKSHARQLISHGHFTLNGKKFNIPSYTVKVGDIIGADKKVAASEVIVDKINSKDFPVPQWLELDKSKFTVKIIATPSVEDLKNNINPNLIIEYYSR